MESEFIGAPCLVAACWLFTCTGTISIALTARPAAFAALFSPTSCCCRARAFRPFFFPVAIPGWLYALAFLLGSFFALKVGRDNVGHDAHLGGAIIGFVIAAALEPAAVRYNLRVFIAVLGVSVVLLVYLWVNPLFLPGWAFWSGRLRPGRRPAGLPAHRRESVVLDAVLEKIAHTGLDSLTEDEKALLECVSNKFRRRADSAKPKSGLTI